MNHFTMALLAGFLTASLPTFALFHFMLFRVNQHLPPDRRIPHQLYWGDWRKLRNEYLGFYPRSFLYLATVTGAVMCLGFAVALFGFGWWEYFAGK
jgi:ABC-type spermidine/putrescine transport system permease subunit I